MFRLFITPVRAVLQLLITDSAQKEGVMLLFF